MFEYVFMQHAFVAGLVLGMAIPCVGVVVVLKHLSLMGDALSHASLAGVAGGLVAGIDPVLGSAIACLGAAGATEIARKRVLGRQELAIALVLACAVGLAGVLSGFTPNAASFSSFLFGSIVAVDDGELAAVTVVGIAVIAFCALCHRQLLLVTLDEQQARLAGVNVRLVNGAFVLACALAISVGSRTVGALVVSSMMVVPVACALTVARSWRQMVVLSCGAGLVMSAVGLVISYAFGLKPGGTIVLVGIGFLMVLTAGKALAGRVRRRGCGENGDELPR